EPRRSCTSTSGPTAGASTRRNPGRPAPRGRGGRCAGCGAARGRRIGKSVDPPDPERPKRYSGGPCSGGLDVRGILGSLLVLIAPLAAGAQQRGAPQQLQQPRSTSPRPASPSATAALVPFDPFPPPAPAVNDMRSGAWQQHRSLVGGLGP